MNAVQILYPYALAAVNLAIAWLSYALFTPEFAVPFLVIGLLVLLTVVGQTVRRYVPVPGQTGLQCEGPW